MAEWSALDAADKGQLLREARTCKEALSCSSRHEVDLSSLRCVGTSTQAVRQVWGPDDVANATTPVLQRLWHPMRRLAEDYKLQYAQCPCEPSSQQASANSSSADRFAPPPRRVTQLVLVGGSTKSPCIREFAKSLAGVQPCGGVDPEHAVAIGAAVHAGLMEGTISGLEMTDSVFSKGLQDRVSGFQL